MASRADYKRVAEVIGRRKAQSEMFGPTWDALDQIQADLADEFAEDNCRFDRDRFYNETAVIEVAWRLVYEPSVLDENMEVQ